MQPSVKRRITSKCSARSTAIDFHYLRRNSFCYRALPRGPPSPRNTTALQLTTCERLVFHSKPYSSTKHYSAARYLPSASLRTGYVRCYSVEASIGIHDDCNRGSRCHVKFHGISSCPHLRATAVFRHTGATRGTHFAFLCADQPNLHASGVLGLRWSVRQCSLLRDQVS